MPMRWDETNQGEKSDGDNNTDDDDLRGAKETKQGEAARPGERTIPKYGKKRMSKMKAMTGEGKEKINQENDNRIQHAGGKRQQG